jgi:hypothetical protein
MALKDRLIDKMLLLACSLFFSIVLIAQSDSDHVYKVNLGVGLGLDYGGVGCRVGYIPFRYLQIYGGAGYNFAEIAYNAGAAFRILPNKNVCPYVGAIYGYNAVIKIIGTGGFQRSYYGPSIQAGIEIRSYKKKNFFNLEILYPFRSDAYYLKMDELLNNPNIKFVGTGKPQLVSIGLGYHFAF